jgi:menaquinone-9 beta-reductase
MEHRLRETDVFVAGGGPAGLAAAIAARQKGLRVMVADVCRPPIEKPCGEGLMPDAVAALQGLGVSFPRCFPFGGVRFSGSGVSVEARFPSGYGAGVRRRTLHELLVGRAEAAGVSLVWGARVAGVWERGVVVDSVPVRCRWIIGADGENSAIRRWAGLDEGLHCTRRFGFRRHYRLRPWSDCVEVYWGRAGQFYVTPVSREEICVVLISRDPRLRIAQALADFPELRERLEGAAADAERGAVSVSRRLRNVVRGNVALVGDASGSVDAITGEGLSLAFRQTAALADALEAGDLRAYEEEHRRTLRRPALMARLLLLLDRSPAMRDRALRAMAANPSIFANLLAAHVAEHRASALVWGGIVPLSWRMLAAG